LPPDAIRDYNRHRRNRFSKLPFYRFFANLQRSHPQLGEVSDKERLCPGFLPI
jgi:hypothetical protein